MGYGTTSGLKFCKKRDQWENSTQSCRVEYDEKTGHYTGYSYAQVIMAYSEVVGGYVYNSRKFSVTTSSHQSVIINFIESENSKKPIWVSMTTLNYGFTFENIETDSENISIVGKYFPGRLDEFKKAIEKKIKGKKERRTRKRLVQALYNLNYSNEKNLLKALEKYKKISKLELHKRAWEFLLIEKAFLLNISKETLGKIFRLTADSGRRAYWITAREIDVLKAYEFYIGELPEDAEQSPVYIEYVSQKKLKDIV